MKQSDLDVSVCVHGHFYQPPRENPWLEEIEREESAAPLHNWNERITRECYAPNAASRILDADGRVTALSNNYQGISYNVGPTLLRWLERHARDTYQAILDADRESHARTRGHGNAIAQVYNHVILPLANRRDKVTQVRWGMRDFEHRFGRKPEGMWLAETACDAETLEVLAEEGIKFTILSPHQAARFRIMDGSGFQDCSDGSIPTGRAYLYQPKQKRPLHLFFYDGDIAKGIAFQGLLGDAGQFVRALSSAAQRAPAGEPWLVHTATDGESYGHHFAHGDMALAAALWRIQRRTPDAAHLRLSNYAHFLATHPVRAEADIKDVSAWSCAHGVGRWERDCGCQIGSPPSWNQRWRGPLREALNLVRDRLAAHYERAMGDLVDDPWAVRDAAIDIILTPEATPAFIHQHQKRALSDEERVRLLQLLEMQRAALLMFTSCGWFFDDIAGGESVILMKYAARALELGVATGADPGIEDAFCAVLHEAKSNTPGPGGVVVSGADLYRTRAKTARVDAARLAVSSALLSLSGDARRQLTLHHYRITHTERTSLSHSPVPAVTGRISAVDERTGAVEHAHYALLHFGGLDFRCSVQSDHEMAARHGDIAAVTAAVRRAVLLPDASAAMAALDGLFGGQAYGLKDALLDVREAAVGAIGRERLRLFEDVGRHLVETNRPLLRTLVDLGMPLPAHVRAFVESMLSEAADQIAAEVLAEVNAEINAEGGASGVRSESADARFAWDALHERVDSLVDDARRLGVALSPRDEGAALGDALKDSVRAWAEGGDLRRADAAVALLGACRRLGVKPRLFELQRLLFGLVERSKVDAPLRDRLRQRRDLVDALEDLAGTRFGVHLPP